MIALPPFALVPPVFRFRALVALADRLPLGGDREVVLATFMCARLAWDWPPAIETADELAHRLTATRTWLQGLALPAQARPVFHELLDAMTRRDADAVRGAWERVVALASRPSGGACRTEFRQLSTRLAPQPPA